MVFSPVQLGFDHDMFIYMLENQREKEREIEKERKRERNLTNNSKIIIIFM